MRNLKFVLTTAISFSAGLILPHHLTQKNANTRQVSWNIVNVLALTNIHRSISEISKEQAVIELESDICAQIAIINNQLDFYRYKLDDITLDMVNIISEYRKNKVANSPPNQICIEADELEKLALKTELHTFKNKQNN